MPAKVESCIKELLKDSKFKPNLSKKAREKSAWAICQASQNKKNSDQIFGILYDLPCSVSIDVDDNGKVTLGENEGVEDQTYSDTEELDDLNFDLYFDEDGGSDEMKGYSIFKEINIELADKKEKDEDDKDEVPTVSKLELLRQGEYSHPWYGEIVFDKKYFVSCIQNFVNDVVQREISFDAQHMPWLGAVSWLQKLSLKRRKFKGDINRWVLMGQTELTEDGEEMIRKKRFKYFSIEVHDNFQDRESGEEYGPTVMGGGVTNRPFIPGMLPVELSENAFKTGEAEPGESSKEGIILEEATNKEVDDVKELQNCIESLEKVIKIKEIRLEDQVSDRQLPDAAFALVKKDKANRVVKRALAHHNSDVKSFTENISVEVGQLRKALGSLNQIKGFTPYEVSKAKSHLFAHVREMYKECKEEKLAAPAASTSTQKGVEDMDFEQIINDLQKKFDALDDKSSDLAKAYTEQIKSLTDAQEASENSAKEQKAMAEKQAQEQSKKFQDQEAKLKNLEEANTKLNARFEEADEERRQSKIQLFCDGMEKADHYPATIDVAKKFLLASKNEFSITTKLSDDGEDENFDLMRVFEEILNSIPNEKRVLLTETLKQEKHIEPKEGTANEGVKLDDGNTVDVMDPKRIAAAAKRRQFKTKTSVQ